MTTILRPITMITMAFLRDALQKIELLTAGMLRAHRSRYANLLKNTHRVGVQKAMMMVTLDEDLLRILLVADLKIGNMGVWAGGKAKRRVFTVTRRRPQMRRARLLVWV